MQTSVAPSARELEREIHIFNFNAAPEYSQTERERIVRVLYSLLIDSKGIVLGNNH